MIRKSRALLLFFMLTTTCTGTRGELTSYPPPPDSVESSALPGPTRARHLLEPLARPYFDDGPLARGRELFDEDKWGKAADELFAQLEKDELELSEGEDRAARFLLALAELRAERYAYTETHLRALADTDWELADYARALAAEAALGAEHFEEARSLGSAVPDGAVLRDHARVIASRALVGSGALEEGLASLRSDAELVSTRPKRIARLEIARTLEALGQSEAAADAFQLVIDEHGSSKEGRVAKAELKKLLPGLSKDAQKRFQLPGDPLSVGRRHFEAHRSEKAIETLTSFREGLKKKDLGQKGWCEASYLIAKSYSKLRKHDDASGFYDEVISSCPDYVLKGLYNCGRAHWNASRQDTAVARFQRVVDEYPEHSYADDALLYIARIQAEKGKEDDAIHTLRAQLEAYPQGDMAKDAHWLLFRALYVQGRFQDAAEYAASIADNAGEDDMFSRGRLSYFRARALEAQGKLEEAVADFDAVIRQFPLSYYALLAFGGVHRIDPEKASGIVDELWSGPLDPERDAVPLAPGLVEESEFRRGVELVRLGLFDWARREFETLAPEYSAEGNFHWNLAEMYTLAGAFHESYRVAGSDLESASYLRQSEDKARWSMAYPRPWLGWVLEAAEKSGVDHEMAYSIMRVESAFKPWVESWANARGLMQLMESTASSTAKRIGMPPPTASDLFEPEIAIALGVAYLGKLGDSFGQHPVFVSAGYNGGQGNVGRWLKERPQSPLDLWVEDISYGQTRKYTKKVLTAWWRYHWLYSNERGVPFFDPAQPAAEAAAGEGN